jgi:MarR family transcriptional regulator, 2-MHQ and catechol-resistance regulon repressor
MPTHYRGSDEERLALDVFIKLLRGGESVAQRASRSLFDAGVTPGQFGVLDALYHHGPLMLSEIAAKHLRSRNNMTVVADNLEKQGLVRRERDSVDRRVIRIHLTDTGHALVERVLPCHVAEVVREISALTPAEQEQLNGLLRKLGVPESTSGPISCPTDDKYCSEDEPRR